MSGADCGRMALLVQADHDGELDAADAVAVLAHVAGCAECAALRGKLACVSAALQNERFRTTASDRLRRTVSSRAADGRRLAVRQGGWALAGAALAACVGLAVLPRGPQPEGDAAALLDDHLRALQPGHLMDVVSTDRHTVKPWFDGRLDYAPPVRDFAAAGFPLKGARLDYVAGRPVAALVYGRGGHVIDLYVFPARDGRDRRDARRGYNLVAWWQDGMAFEAVSDLAAADLAHFRALWAAAD